MNTEKAIKLLHEMQEAWKLQITGDAFDALEMAITALQVQDKLQDMEYMCNLSGGADYFHAFKVLSTQQETCDTCKHGYFGDEQCNSCRVRFTSHYERRTK